MKDLICKLVNRDTNPETFEDVVKRMTHKESSECKLSSYSINTSLLVIDYDVGRRPKRVFLTQIKGFKG